MEFTYAACHALHAPEKILIRGAAVPNMEVPERLDALLLNLQKTGHTLVETVDFGREWISAVHDVGYLTFLETAHQRWQKFQGISADANMHALENLIHPHVFPHHSTREKPSSIQGQVGLYLSGGSCPMDSGTWEAAVGSVNSALTASQLVLKGAKQAYALCRPPGHHAYADLAGGFCYLNNAAISANYLASSLGRVAIIDIDAHHGNGTQSIFYKRNDVYFTSVHTDPDHLFPFYAGYAHERGEGAGLGYNLNLPLPLGASDDMFSAAISEGMASILNYGPAALVVSLGFDAFKGDPSAGLSVSTPGFRSAGQLIGRYKGPVVLIQEGGYVIDSLAENMTAFLDGFLAARQ